jgi:hypothetical protein
MRPLRLDEPARTLRPVAQEIGAGIVDDVADHVVFAPRNAVDRAIGELGQRHGGGIDALLLRPPLLGDRLGEGTRGQQELPLARRAYWLAVEQEREPPVPVPDIGALVEPLRKIGTRRGGLAGIVHAF